MSLIEVNFDGLIGPTHNYCGLSPGNLASHLNADAVSHPRAAALQGLEKMRAVLALGGAQGFLPPPPRPAISALRALGFVGADNDVLSAVAEQDPILVCANLSSMPHRALEAADTLATLRTVFADQAHFAVHAPLPYGAHFGDEGAANHMRLAGAAGGAGVNVFVHGAARGGPFPERQALRASQAVARLAGVADPVFALQSASAIAAGAFHNDVVAVANGPVLLAHRDAFEDAAALIAALAARVPGFQYLEVGGFGLDKAVSAYLFNSQLISRPGGGMTLVAPAEARAEPDVWAEVERLIGGEGPIDQVQVVDLRESMRNGGGPACLRLRVPLSPRALAAVDQRFLLSDRRIDALAALVEQAWPTAIAPADLSDPALWAQSRAAHAALGKRIAAWA